MLDDPIAVTNSRYYDNFCFYISRRRLIVRYEMRKAQKGSFECCWRYRLRSFLIVPQIHHERNIPPEKKTLGQTRCTPSTRRNITPYLTILTHAPSGMGRDVTPLRNVLQFVYLRWQEFGRLGVYRAY